MLEILPPDYKFCPFCGDPLETKIEEEKERKFCPKDRWTYYPHVGGAAGAVVIYEGKVLMVQRNREPYLGTWMFPAGFIEYGEHPRDTAVREALEETGYQVKNPKLIEVYQVDDDPRSCGHFCFFFSFDLDGEDKQKVVDTEENSSINWFGIDNLPQIGWHDHKTVAKLLQEGKIF